MSNNATDKGVLVDPDKLDFFLGLGLNVLLVGEHGVGKTQIIQEAFRRNNLRGLYLSGSTLDPWVDVIGIPEIVRDDPESNGMAYTAIIPPKKFVLGEVEAIFIDELNRAPKKVRNALMELIQFGSINGVKYPNLKTVWAAINPHDEDDMRYDVEPLDPALEDRFHVKVDVEYRPCPVYMRKAYGQGYASPAIKWWSELPDNVKKMVSPRRLCYALDYHMNAGDVRDILPYESHPDKLVKDLIDAPELEIVGEYLHKKDYEGLRERLKDDNFYTKIKVHLVESVNASVFILPLLSKERRMSLITEGHVMETMVKNSDRIPEFKESIQTFISHSGNKQGIEHVTTLIHRYNMKNEYTNLADKN